MYKETLTLIYNFDDNHISLTSSNLHFKRQILTQTVVKCTVVKFFPFLAQVACFPTYDSAYMFYYAWLCLHVFPLMTLLTCFPTHDTGYMFCHTWPGSYMFSYAWLCLLVFPHMTLLTCFPILDTGCMFPNTWLGFHVFLSLRLVTCFPTRLGVHVSPRFPQAHMTSLTCFLCLTLVTYFFIAWFWSMCQAFPIFPLVICFAAARMFYQAWKHLLHFLGFPWIN